MRTMNDHTDERGGRHSGGRHDHRGRHGRHGGWGPGRMERGALRFVLLDALRSGPRHGYELIKEMEEVNGNMVPPWPADPAQRFALPTTGRGQSRTAAPHVSRQ